VSTERYSPARFCARTGRLALWRASDNLTVQVKSCRKCLISIIGVNFA
jgi:hypothetical protein